MEFDVGNILYIVITLVAVIVGVLGRKKKKKQATTGSEPGEVESRGGFMENIERVLRMGQENPEVADLQDYESDLSQEQPEYDVFTEEPVADSQRATKGIVEDYGQMLQRLQSRESDIFLNEAERLNETLDVVQLDEEEDSDYFEIIKDFDAGTAVVYSAIINRVDY